MIVFVGFFPMVRTFFCLLILSGMLRVGAHTSIAGGIHLAFERSKEIGGNTLQIFAKSPRGRNLPHYDAEEYRLCAENRKKYGQIGGLIHANYLANLSKPFDECQADIKSIIHDFEVGHHAGFEAINVHVGKGKGHDDITNAYKNMAHNVEYILKEVQKHGYSPKFLFEITAGQGSELGYLIEDLGKFYQGYLKHLPIAFCFDTAHAWGGGNDLRQREKLMEIWEKNIGLDKLYCFHLNDSKAALGSHLDRHAPLGRGAIGFPVIKHIIQWAVKHDKPIFLETSEPDLWAEEIELIKKIEANDTKRIETFDKEHSGTHLLKKFQGEQNSLF